MHYVVYSDRDLPHPDIIVTNRNPVKRSLRNVNGLVRARNHVLGPIDMITNGRLDDHYQKSGNAVTLKISVVVRILFYLSNYVVFIK